MIKLLREQLDECAETEIQKRGIANAFDIDAIQEECDKYSITFQMLPERAVSNDCRALTLVVAMPSSVHDLTASAKEAARIALIVDYSSDSAYAMARGGCDKTMLMYICSVANKHIRAPFRYNSEIRTKYNN